MRSMVASLAATMVIMLIYFIICQIHDATQLRVEQDLDEFGLSMRVKDGVEIIWQELDLTNIGDSLVFTRALEADSVLARHKHLKSILR